MGQAHHRPHRLISAVAMVASIIVHAVFQVFQLGFRGLTVDPLGGAALAGAAAAACAYFAVIIADEVTSVVVVGLVVADLFLGTLASMIQSPEATWWQFHFSRLGNDTGINGYQFNISLQIAGLLLTTLANHIGHDIALGCATAASATLAASRSSPGNSLPSASA